MKLKSKTTATLLIAIFMISAFTVVIPSIAEDVLIDATTQAGSVTLTLLDDGHGTITADPSAPYVYPPAQLVSLTPIADADYVFDYWTLDEEVQSDLVPLKVTMDADHTVEAFFRIKVVSIVVAPGEIHFPTAIINEINKPNPDVVLSVENNGDIYVTVTAKIPGTSSGDIFFRNYFRLDATSAGLKGWLFSLDPDTSTSKIPTLDLNGASELGTFSSMLVVTAVGVEPGDPIPP